MTKTASTDSAAAKGTKAAKAPATKAPAKDTKASKVPVKSDVIKSVVSIASGMEGLAADADGQKSIIIPKAKLNAVILKLAVVGGSYAALAKAVAEASQAQLARGIKGREAPHSAKALADNAAALKGTKADAPKGKTAPKADKPKSPEKQIREAVSKGNDRAYTVVNKNHGARPDSKRAMQLEIVFKHKSTAAARAAGAESCDFRYAVDKGFIKFA